MPLVSRRTILTGLALWVSGSLGDMSLSLEEYAYKTVVRVNEMRTAQDLRPLGRDECVRDAAQAWALRLLNTGLFEHRDMGFLLRHCNAIAAGECIGRGYTWPGGLVKAWMASPNHHDVLTNPVYRRIGVGIVVMPNDELLVVADLIAR